MKNQRPTTPHAALVTLTRSQRCSSSWRCAATLMLATGLTIGALQLVSATRAMINAGSPTTSPGHSQAQTTYVGESSLTEALRDNQVQPLALASADFDEDGMADLVAGYATSSGGGIVTIQRGNVHALFPYGDALREGEPPAFLPTTRVFALPESPDFMGTGDFDADGHWDVVAARRGSNALYFLAGDKQGGFRAAERTELSGRITALTTGDINRVDGLTDIVVGIDGISGAQGQRGPVALVLESPIGAIKTTPEVVDLPAATTSFTLGQFAGDGWTDLAIAAGDELLVVTGRDRKLSLDASLQQQVGRAVVTSRKMSFSVNAMVAGNFNGESEGGLALGAPDGRIFLLTPPTVAVAVREANAQVAVPATDVAETSVSVAAAVATVEDNKPTFIAETDRPVGDWHLSEVEGSSSADTSRTQGRLTLIRARVSGASNDDLMVIGGENRRLRLMTTGTDKRARHKAVASAIAAEEEPVAVLPMRLNQDGVSDLVILKKSSSVPSFVMSAAAAVFTVNTAADINNDFRCDATYCSLRGAISAANANPGADMIVFNIPGTGVHTINTVVGFTNITDPVTIDGYTQPGSSPNTLANGDNAVLQIEINGAAAQLGSSGFGVFGGDNNVFRGLVIGGYRFQQGSEVQAGGFGIVFFGSGSASNNFVEGCFIGTNAAGDDDNANTNGGIWLFDNANNNTFGGTTPAARNLLSGNGRSGRAEINASAQESCSACETLGNKVLGNFIGTDITGTSALLPRLGPGVFFYHARMAQIGGTAAGSRNIIAGNSTGISFRPTSGVNELPGTLTQGNFVGLDVNGTVLSNFNGVNYGAVRDSNFGGTTPAAANTISGNLSSGFDIANFALNNVIQGNFIGTNAAGANKGNGSHGIFISAPGGQAQFHTIGGVAAGAGNTIAFNGGNGITIAANQFAIRNTIRGNSIHSNGGLGIDLANNGVTPNDACDTDTGANELQNFPALTDAPSGTFFVTATATNANGNTSEFSPCVRAQVSGGNLSIQGGLESVATGTFTLDFYSNSACDPSGNGEGQTYLGSTTVTTASCNAVIAVSLPTPTPTPTPSPSPSPTPATVQFSQSNFPVPESAGFVNVNVTRSGDTGTAVAVDYTTSDGTALQRTDYTIGAGTVKFAPGQTSRTLNLLISEDSYVEGNESFTVTLNTPVGATIGTQGSATVTINDDDTTTPATVQPMEDANIFVRQHYHDLLAREGDSGGIAYWTNEITQCGANATCLRLRRVAVSDAFFFEPEYQDTAAYLYRIYKVSFNNFPSYTPFMRDRSRLVGGVVLDAAKNAFNDAFVQRAAFLALFPLTMTPAQYVDALNANTSNALTPAQRDALVNGLAGNTETRGSVLRKVAENSVFIDQEYNNAFVVNLYFGYLRRDPEPGGFNFWLTQINSAPLRNVARQQALVCSFITSQEYQERFSSVVTRTNADCAP